MKAFSMGENAQHLYTGVFFMSAKKAVKETKSEVFIYNNYKIRTFCLFMATTIVVVHVARAQRWEMCRKREGRYETTMEVVAKDFFV